ncbi:hypothetical protein F5X99DRAFT_378823 [Biscogniauxia marginata]|nr:hypothetical protein F5X99DRAFT_378823 [Biscogniauxia marginata]
MASPNESLPIPTQSAPGSSITAISPTSPEPKTDASINSDSLQKATYTYVDPDGDLHLEVGDNEAARLFVVCSKSLARSSPFWKKLLYGKFAESIKPDHRDDKTEWVVRLPDDDPESMKMLLNIVHGRFEFVPGYEAHVPTHDLYKLCVLLDKYDMTHVLRPWASGWSKTVYSAQSYLDSVYCEQLWISWVLGDKTNFEHTTRALVLNCACTLTPETLQPPEIYERIEQTRLDMINKLLAPFHNTLQRLIEDNKSFCTYRSHNGCTRIMLGTAIQSPHTHGFWPIPQPQEVQVSIQTLADSLKKVKVEGESGTYSSCTQTSTLQAGVDKTLKSIPSFLTANYRRHLSAQAEKSGLL